MVVRTRNPISSLLHSNLSKSEIAITGETSQFDQTIRELATNRAANH